MIRKGNIKTFVISNFHQNWLSQRRGVFGSEVKTIPHVTYLSAYMSVRSSVYFPYRFFCNQIPRNYQKEAPCLQRVSLQMVSITKGIGNKRLRLNPQSVKPDCRFWSDSNIDVSIWAKIWCRRHLGGSYSGSLVPTFKHAERHAWLFVTRSGHRKKNPTPTVQPSVSNFRSLYELGSRCELC